MSTQPRLGLWDKLKLARILRNPTMIAKLKSRKLWVTVATAAITVLGEQLGIPPAVTDKLVLMASAYVLGQGIADSRGF